ncbi:hypothetical protein BGZ61DRAFT_439311 [Ilyonectria robusta]|uniref:uncharacterized protein n=1 Tax=Ilyonectria robusta TaxID=1079257 RepID=UPI001E8DA82A|nr:uncharacterized protein BGZ61DRAFT_439311 [Ilyonectria robusta]KAH8737952.1 hypothetical protein BGZ61DRAFT_439311 [Ilyonectria robusta]
MTSSSSMCGPVLRTLLWIRTLCFPLYVSAHHLSHTLLHNPSIFFAPPSPSFTIQSPSFPPASPRSPPLISPQAAHLRQT